MVAEALYFVDDKGKYHPSYVLDLCGRVIFCSNDGSASQPISHAVCAKEYHYEQSLPLSWELSPEDIEGKINSYSTFASGIKIKLSKAYPTGKLARKQAVYFPEPKTGIPEIPQEDVFKALEMIGDDDSGEIHTELTKALNQVGVFRIPQLSVYDERYHELSGGIIVNGFAVERIGWASNSIVYQKTLVRALPA
jgi:hypothetical protein